MREVRIGVIAVSITAHRIAYDHYECGNQAEMVEYFEKPEIDLSQVRIIAVFTAFNEIERIEHFLSYYRSIGVEHFLAIDNASSDDSAAVLQRQSDVSYFQTSTSYVESKAGRLWTSELANHYCVGKWCLTLDLDEILVFPGSDHTTLQHLCMYLDEHGFDGLFTVFLDMYSGGPLSEAIYTSGQPFLDVCDHFETSTYTLTQPMHFPHIGVFGGPRQRIFWEQGKRGKGPSMRKLPLVKWQKGFRYLYSTHSSSPINLADITGALLHFKFFSSFKTFAARELSRGDRVQVEDYANYVRLVSETNLVFKTDQSVKYESATTLVEHGVMVCTLRYLNWLKPRIAIDHGPRVARKCEQGLRSAIKSAMEGAVLRMSQLPIIWSLLASSNDGGIIAVRDRRVVGWFLDRVGRYPTREIEAQIDGAVVAVGNTGFKIGEEALVDQDQRENLFEITIPESVFSQSDTCRVFFASRRDPVAFASIILKRVPELGPSDKFQGSCHFSPEGRLIGWVWCPTDPGRGIAVTIHIDGRYWCRVVANRFREKLKAREIGDGSHGFSIDLPDWLEPDIAHVAHIAVDGTNMQLRRSPLEFVPVKSDAAKIEPSPEVQSPHVIWKASTNVFLPTTGIRVGDVIGQVLAVRRGVIYGWIADGSDWTRTLDVELVVRGRVRRVVSAKTKIPIIADVPPRFQSHGFAMPVVPSWSPPILQQEYHHVALRERGSKDFLGEELLIAGPRIGLSQSRYRGFIDSTENGMLQGWAWRIDCPDDRIDVALFIDGKLLARVRAADFRQDLQDANIGKGYHGFSVAIPGAYLDGVEHKIDIVIADEGISLTRAVMLLKDGKISSQTLRSKLIGNGLERLSSFTR